MCILLNDMYVCIHFNCYWPALGQKPLPQFAAKSAIFSLFWKMLASQTPPPPPGCLGTLVICDVRQAKFGMRLDTIFLCLNITLKNKQTVVMFVTATPGRGIVPAKTEDFGEKTRKPHVWPTHFSATCATSAKFLTVVAWMHDGAQFACLVSFYKPRQYWNRQEKDTTKLHGDVYICTFRI